MSSSGRFAVVHGHFYQPPRENPWLETVPREAGAQPFHDWNERIAAECYGANASSRRLDPVGRIDRISNNYRQTSFDFGPTLLSWLERARPDVHAAVVAADRDSAARLGGHGNAIAQAYNHTILPLSNDRDRLTQVRWGLADFEYRFGRPARGLWLPETAVDTGSLEALAACGVEFTILAPHQASRVRPLGGGDWRHAGGGSIDTRRPYLCRLPSGRTIALFFYDATLARAVAFEGVLHDGDRFADRILAAFDGREGPQLVHLATDGESYGHHHRFGDMALSVALDRLADAGVRLSSYAAFLAECPPAEEVEIVERTAWSCAHGVERWRSDCGCRAAAVPGWDQQWRSGLRVAFDALADAIDPWFESQAGALVREPWEMRDDFGRVLVDPARSALVPFLEGHATRPLSRAEAGRLAVLLEMQRARLFMFTSCGWFFDEPSGIETTQVLRYAARAIELGARLGFEPPPAFLDALSTARSNRPEVGTAADWFRQVVAPEAVSSRRLAAAGTVERLVGVRDGVVADPPIRIEIEPWLERETSPLVPEEEANGSRLSLGAAGILVGLATVVDERTLERASFTVAASRHGGFDVVCAAARAELPEEARRSADPLVAALSEAHDRGAHGTVVAEIVRRLGPEVFGLDVLGLASRSAFFPAVADELGRSVASRLGEFVPLARAIAHEATLVGEPRPAVVDLVLGLATSGARANLAGDRLRDGLLRIEERSRRVRSSGWLSAADLEDVREDVRRVAAGVRLRALAGGQPVPLEAQDILWWRIWAQPDVDPRLQEALDPLRDLLGFSPSAPATAAASADFAALLSATATGRPVGDRG